MSKFCGTCGSSLNEGQKFCGKCGSAGAASQQTPAQPDQQAYTSPAPPPFAPVTQLQSVAASISGSCGIQLIAQSGHCRGSHHLRRWHRRTRRRLLRRAQGQRKSAGGGASGGGRDSVLSGRWTCGPWCRRRRTRPLQKTTTAAASKEIPVVFSARKKFPAPWASRLFAPIHKASDATTSPKAIPPTWSPNI